MSTSTTTTSATTAGRASSTFVTMLVHGQLCGIPVLKVRDVIASPAMTPIPMAPPAVAGSLNLRGRIVTAIDLRRRLRLLAGSDGGGATMSVVVEQQGELYSLIVDSVCEVIELAAENLEPTPPTLGAAWRDVSTGIYRLQSDLLVVLNTERVLAVGLT